MNGSIGVAFGNSQAISVPTWFVFIILALALIGAWSLKKKHS